MCHLAVAETAASLEMSCVTIVFFLLREAGCKLSFANGLGMPLVLAAWPRGFGKPMEGPAWWSVAGQPKSRLPSERWLLANPVTSSISVQTPLAACSKGLDAGKRQGHSWCFDTRFPKLCRDSLASRRAFSSLRSSRRV